MDTVEDRLAARGVLQPSLRFLAVAVAYYVSAKLSLQLALVGESVTPLWIPTGVAVFALLIVDRHAWIGIAAGAFLVNLPISPSVQVAALIAVGNTLAPLTTVWVLRMFDFGVDMQRLRDAIALVIAALMGMLVSASIGAAALSFGGLGTATFGSAWWVWWAGDAMGVLIIGPALFWLRRASIRQAISLSRRIEASVMLAGLVVVTSLALATELKFLYLAFPFVIWLSLRFYQAGAVSASVVASGLAIWAASEGIGPFAGGSLSERMLSLQLFNASVALTAFALAALNFERMSSHRDLVQAGVELENRVHRQTAKLNAVVGKLAEAQRIAHLGNWEWDIQCDEVTWSDELCNIFGVDPQTYRGSYQAFLDRVHAEDRKAVDLAVRRSMETGEEFEFRHRVVRPDGEERVVYGRGALVTEGGKTVRMVGIALDVTARSNAEEAYKASEERLRLVLDTASDAFVAMDPGGHILRWNKQAEAIFGWSREEALGRPLAETIIPPGLRDAHKKSFARHLKTGESTILNRRVEVMALHRSGREFPVELTVWPVTLKGRTNFNAFIKDVTEQKRTEKELALRAAELKRSNAELAQFAYVASHDLQEPIRMVSSYVELLDRRYADKLDDDGREFIGYAVEGATRMQSLIQALLSYARVDSQGSKPAPVDLGKIIDNVLADLETVISETSAEVVVGPLPTIEADPHQMSHLFQNLIANAIKFRSEEAPVVSIQAEQSEDDWTFSIADNGIGIDPEFSERIFNIFQRLHGRDDYPGSGIGLSLCKRIVEQKGGRIWVEPRPTGGSVFSFTLPAVISELVDA